MRFQRVVLSVVLSGTLATFSGCGSTPVKEQSAISYTSAQVEQISDYNELLGAYQSSSQALAGKDPNLYAADFAVLKSMGAKLVALRKQSWQNKFNAARLSSGEVPQNVLTPARKEAENPPLPKSQWQPVSDLVNAEWEKTASAVKARVDQLEVGDLSDDIHLVTMDDLYRLTGSESWLAQRNAFVDKLIAEIREARAAGTLDAELQPKIELVLENRADDESLKEELVAVSAEIYQKDYFTYLGEGLVDKAYDVFLKMSSSKNFDAIKLNLKDVSQNMVDYFVEEADKSVKNPENLSQSYRWYSQAKVVSGALGLQAGKVDGHGVLVEQLNDKYKALIEAEQSTLALAYLHYIQEFRPLYKGLRQMISETTEKVSSLAMRRISTTAFDGNQNQGYGNIISSKITQHLFQHVPNDVRIVEREQYEAIQRERNLGGANKGLSAVDLLVTGSVLEAKVDTTEQKGKKTIRAVVGKETIPNAAYISWLELPPKDRKDIEKPSDTITVDKEENIPVNVTNHRKVGIFSVSYRLVDAANGRVLFPDSITKEEAYKGTSREGVEMGDFVLPFELADLPSDVKILDSLANQVALDIGASLVEKLKDQEKKYLAEAEDFKKDNSCALRADRLAKAFVILKAKSMDSTPVFEEYKDTAINCEAVL